MSVIAGLTFATVWMQQSTALASTVTHRCETVHTLEFVDLAPAPLYGAARASFSPVFTASPEEGRVSEAGAHSGRLGPSTASGAYSRAAPGPGPTFPLINEPGLHSGDASVADLTLDVGHQYVVQGMNFVDSTGRAGQTQFQVFDKLGRPQDDPVSMTSLWTDPDNICANVIGAFGRTNGDPIVVYDEQARRWVIGHMNRLPNNDGGWCLAVSATEDIQDGRWNCYGIEGLVDGKLADYPKLGVWGDAYYISSRDGDFDLGLYAVERDKMLAGQPARLVREHLDSLEPGLDFDDYVGSGYLPADLDGAPPPAGTPGYFARHVDDPDDVDDRIEIYRAEVDWSVDPPDYDIVLDASLPVEPFSIMKCHFTRGDDEDCIPEPNSDSTLYNLSSWPMYSLRYRRFGSSARMVLTHTYDAARDLSPPGTRPVAGVRWYELQHDSSGWSIRQFGSHSPQLDDIADEGEYRHRAYPSAVLDRFGSIGLGYGISNGDDDPGESIYAGIRFTGRVVDDPFGQMSRGEGVIHEGVRPVGSIDSRRRWSDYSTIAVDPDDGCTFYYTNAYPSDRPDADWESKIASFRFGECENTRPQARCKSVTVAANGQCIGEVSAADIDDGSSDPDNDPLTCTLVPGEGLFPLGSHSVTMRCEDPQGASDSCRATVTVEDQTPPVFVTRPSDLVIDDCNQQDIGVAEAIDNCVFPVPVTQTPFPPYPLGKSIVSWLASDGVNESVYEQSLTVLLGDDPACCPPGTTIWVGTDGPDYIPGSNLDDCIIGLGGPDQLYGLGGNDYISGGAGDDQILPGEGNDHAHGGVDRDTIVDHAGDDFVYGGPGSDTINMSFGEDVIFGQGGDDTISAALGIFLIDGGDHDAYGDTCTVDPGTPASAIVNCEHP